MPDLPPAEQLDFLLEHGERYAILGSGERIEPGDSGLPSNAGTHLVAGKARKGVFSFHELPPGVPRLDPVRRWLGIQGYEEPTLDLFDPKKALSPAFRFQLPGLQGRVAIHPQGDLIATREGDDLILYGPDGHRLRSASFPRSNEWWAAESFEFSTCGEFLWLASTPPDGKAVLHLLRSPSLEVSDSCDPSWNPDSPYDQPGSWREISTSTNPATGHLAIRRQAGDDFLTLHFYDIKESKIRLLGSHVTAIKDNIPGERVWTPVFAPDGKRFLLLDSDGFLHEFSFPDCRRLATAQQTDLRKDPEDYDARIDSYGYAGPLVLIKLRDEVLALRSGDLRLSPWYVDANVKDYCTVLPNGLLCTRYIDATDLNEFRLRGRPFPIVAAIDSKTTRATAVYRKARSRWQEIDDEVGWLEMIFAVRRE
jgi:hypothetical protein